MSTSNALPKILAQLKEEWERDPQIIVPYDSWDEYRKRQQMWNPSYYRAAELDLDAPVTR